MDGYPASDLIKAPESVHHNLLLRLLRIISFIDFALGHSAYLFDAQFGTAWDRLLPVLLLLTWLLTLVQHLPITMHYSAPEGLACSAGLANGVLLRTQVDRITGQLSDTRTRFLGTRPPKLFAANVKGQRSMLSLSSRPWLGYSDMGRYNLTPLSYEALDYASGMPPINA